MDVDFWSSRVDLAKQLSSVQYSGHYHSADIHLGLSDSEGDENARAFFPCPFCYVDIEVHVLCCHLQDEHCFDLKDVVCPLCSANLGKDVTGHFIAQHANSLKRRRRSHKTVVGSSTSGRTNILEISTDPLLFPFLGGVPDLESKGSQEDNSLGETSPKIHLESGDLSSSNDDVDREERRQRAAFIQELITSTIFF